MGVGGEGDECGTEGLVSGVRGRMDSLIRSSTLSRLSSFLSPPFSTFHFLSASVYSSPPLKNRAQAKFRQCRGELGLEHSRAGRAHDAT